MGDTAFNKLFTSSEVGSWLVQNRFAAETIETISAGKLDGEDLCDVYKDEGEMRHFFPMFKERKHFKQLIQEVLGDIQEKASVPSDDLGYHNEDRHSYSPEHRAFPSDESLSVLASSSFSGSPSSSSSLSYSPECSLNGNAPDPALVRETSASPTAVHTAGIPSRKVLEWTSKYQLPTRFSASVEAGLQAGNIPINVQNEFIRDVCTSILHYSSHPSKAERIDVAKLIVKTYPCMADKKILDCSTDWGSLELKIMNRMKKLQKPKRVADSSGDDHGKAPRKRKMLDEDAWGRKPSIPEGETRESLQEYTKAMHSRLVKKPRDVKLHKEFLDHSFPLRRLEILQNPCPVKEVICQYPSLKQFVHLRGEICRIFDNNELPSQLREKYRGLWQPKVMKYATADAKLNEYMKRMEAALSEENCDTAEIKDRTMFLVINKILGQKHGKKRGSQEEVFTILPRNSSVDQEIENFVQPQVVAVGELYDMDLLFIAVEGHVLCNIPQERIVDAITVLLSSFYAFNIVYNQGKPILSFLEQALLGIGRGQTSVSVASFLKSICQ